MIKSILSRIRPSKRNIIPTHKNIPSQDSRMVYSATNHCGDKLSSNFDPKRNLFPPLFVKKGVVTSYFYGIEEADEKPVLICSFRGRHVFQTVSAEAWKTGMFRRDATLPPIKTIASKDWPLPGTIWEHRKGNQYYVKGVAFAVDSNEPFVVYGDLDAKYPFYWLRKVESWNELVDGNKRFKRNIELEDDNNITRWWDD